MFDRINQGLYWDRALTLVEGCTPVSPGCDNCWSAALAHRFGKGYPGKSKQFPKEEVIYRFTNLKTGAFNGNIKCRDDRLELPLKVKKPTVWAVWNDLFHEDVTSSFIQQAFDVFNRCPQHIFIILTKRPERLLNFVIQETHDTGEGYLNNGNVWLGTTVESDAYLWRVAELLKIPAAVRLVSVEPMLGPVDLNYYLNSRFRQESGYRKFPDDPELSLLSWVICGGESGPGARPMHPDWPRALRDQCQAANVPFFFKQWGEWKARLLFEHDKEFISDKWGTLDRAGNWFSQTTPWNGRQGDVSPECEYIMYRIGKKAAGRTLDGKEYLELPKASHDPNA